MKRTRQYGEMGLSSLKALALSLVILFTAAEASASCPRVWASGGGGHLWYELDVDSTCLGSYGISTTTLSCPTGGYSFDTFGSDAIWSFDIPQNNWYPYWSVSVSVDFDSPTHTIYDAIYGTLTVTHGGVNTSYRIFRLQGNSATSKTCKRYDLSFIATSGDTITIEYDASSAGGTVKATAPTVFNSN